MLTHFNLQTPHHEGTGLRTPAPPRAKRVMLVQPYGHAAVASASTADSRCAVGTSASISAKACCSTTCQRTLWFVAPAYALGGY